MNKEDTRNYIVDSLRAIADQLEDGRGSKTSASKGMDYIELTGMGTQPDAVTYDFEVVTHFAALDLSIETATPSEPEWMPLLEDYYEP